MKITPYLKKTTNSKKYPIYIRLRDNFDGKEYQSIISSGYDLEPKYFKNGSISSRSVNYHEINEEITSIITELRIILSELKREDKIPLPNLVKHRYFEKIKQKKFDTPKIKSFWGEYKEWEERKLTNGYINKLLASLGSFLLL